MPMLGEGDFADHRQQQRRNHHGPVDDHQPENLFVIDAVGVHKRPEQVNGGNTSVQ